MVRITALKSEAIQLVERMPEEQMPYIIEYIRRPKAENTYRAGHLSSKAAMTPKMEAFLELERMLMPAAKELDYGKELAEARDGKYGYFSVDEKTKKR